LALILAGLSASRAAEYDWQEKRNALGDTDKFRVLVDKVLSRSNDWVLTESHVREIKEAGFNVVVPRIGGTDMDRVRRVANMAGKHGLFYMAWMRGTLATRMGPRVVWENGVTQDLYSPNTDELWDWMTENILGHARIAVQNPAVVGTFLDFENYAPQRVRNCYFLSYDDRILREFAQASGLTLPALEPAQRKRWLVDNRHHEAFERFQIESWRMRCRELRRKIDAVNPNHQLIVYPIGTLFLDEAIYPTWPTEKSPLVIADHTTYGRRGELPHFKALLANRTRLRENRDAAQAHNVPLLYMGGIDPVVQGADPEFCGKNAVMIAEVTNGYWVFYEGPEYEGTHPAYFKWFTWANRAIVNGDVELWKQPRQEPDPALQAEREILDQFCAMEVKPLATEPIRPDQLRDAFRTRGKNYFCVLLQQGEVLSGTVEIDRIGTYDSVGEITVYGPDKDAVLATKIEPGATQKLHLKADKPGLHVLVVDSGRNAARLRIANRYFCLLTNQPINLIGAQPAGWFLPSCGASSCRIELSSPSPGETVLATIFDSADNKLKKADTVTHKQVSIQVDMLEAAQGKPLSLRLEKASKGTLEDVTLAFGPGSGPFLATGPGRLLVPAK
jgi:hypothetical protein